MVAVLAPASRKQEMFLQSDANIIVYGGAMGGGKSFCGLLRHLRWVEDPNYRGYIVRKNQTTLMKSGGLFDEATTLYRSYDPRVKINKKAMTFTFPSGAIIAMGHLETDNDAEKWRGLQVSAAMVDEATQISEDHTLVILSRLRSKANMVPNLFLTCNPSPDSYLRKWIDWWIIPKGEENAGRPNPDRDGKIRWFIRLNNEMIWADTKEELLEKYGNRDYDGNLIPEDSEDQHCRPLSLQFISATIYDNPPLIKSNPGYLANLQGLKRVKKERDLYGNWDIREDTSGFFKREFVEPEVINRPGINELVRVCRAYDLAGVLKSETNADPDYSVGVKMGLLKSGDYIILDVVRFRARYGEVEKKILEIATEDGAKVDIVIPRDPGQAGLAAAKMLAKTITAAGFYCRMKPTNKSKVERFRPFAAAAENGLVQIVKDCCDDLENKIFNNNEFYYSELESFDGGRKGHDDLCDATADAFEYLATSKKIPVSFKLPSFAQSNPFALQ